MDETSNKVSEHRYVWLVIAIMTLLLSIIGLIFVAYTTRSEYSEVIYPIYADTLGIGGLSLFASFLIPLSFVGIIITVTIRAFRQRHIKRSEIAALAIIVLAGGVFFSTFGLFFVPNTPGRYAEFSEHVASVREAGHVYHLTARTRFFDSHRNYRYMLYECDGFGIYCTMLDFELLCNGKKPSLIVNSDIDSVSVVFEDEIIYQYTPQTKLGRIVATPPRTSTLWLDCQIQRPN